MSTKNLHRGLLAALLLTAGAPLRASDDLARRARGLMGTVLAIETPAAVGADAAMTAAFDEVARLESIFSLYRPASELSLLNRAPAGTAVRVSPDLHALAVQAVRLSSATAGAFDPTVEPLVRLHRVQHEWAEGEWTKAAESVGPAFVDVNEAEPFVTRKAAAAGLNFDGIAKGFALDRAAAKLAEKGVREACFNFGGQMLVVGRGVEARLADPSSGRPIARFDLVSGSASTSSQTEHVTLHGGRPQGHIIDPRSKNVSDRSGSVTVIAPTAAEADALSTALFVLGPIDGLRVLEEKFPHASAVWIESAGIGWRVIPSRGFPKLQILNGAADVALLDEKSAK